MTREIKAPSVEEMEKVFAEELRLNEAALREMTDEDLREMERLLERLDSSDEAD